MLKYSPLLCALILGCSSESTDATTATTDSGTTGTADSDTTATTDGGTTTTDAASTTSDASATTDGSTSTRVSWTPPTGKLTTADPDSPGPRRILLATSPDGLTFTRSAKVLSDQANTPNMIVTSSGEVRIYYTGSNVAGTKDGILVAVSKDEGANWSFYKPTMNGFPAMGPAIGDPDILETEPGKFAMYVTNGITGANKAGIHRTVASDDGFTFTYDRVSFTPATAHSQVDSLTYKIGSSYTMFVIDPPGGKMVRSTSSDGLTFTEQSSQNYTGSSGSNEILSNWMPLAAGGYRVYSFSLNNKSINSFTTTDGVTLTAEAGNRLVLGSDPLEKTWVKDAAVVKLKNGTYLMSYVSEIP